MAVWPFNRRKEQSSTGVPVEVQQYYNAEHRERMGMAWLIAFLSLLVTTALVIAIFFGGRWAYRKIAHKPAKPTTTTQRGTNNTPKDTPKSGSTGAEKPVAGSTGNSGASNTPPQTSSNNTPTPQTTPSNGQLTRTGPDEDL